MRRSDIESLKLPVYSASRVLKASLVFGVVLAISSCSLFPTTPKISEEELVGTWRADHLGASLILNEDMTFEAISIPAGYVYIHPPDGVDLERALSFSGTWRLQAQLDDWYPQNIILHIDGMKPGAYKDLHTYFQNGRLDELILWQGDPDGGDFLAFHLKDTN